MAKVQGHTARAALMAATLLLPVLSAAGSRAEDQVLNIYNWSDYIAPETVPAFEKETGIKVSYDTYDSNETLEAKLAAGHSGYDLVVPSLVPFLAKQIKAGFYQPLDKSRLTNAGHLDPALLKQMAIYDPDNAHAVPWLTGTNGIGYNQGAVKAIDPAAPTDSLKLLFDPAEAAKFKGCGISILDSPTEVFPAVLNYLGLNPDSQDPKDLEKAAAQLEKIRPSIRKFDSSEYINDLANGDLCLAWGYSSDIKIATRRAKEANKGVIVAYTIPVEGTQRWIDTMAIPADAPHPAAALAFINYILRPDVIAQTMDAIYIRSGNIDAVKLVKPEISGDPTIFPPPAVEAKLYTVSVSTPAIDRLRTRLWTKIKSGH